MNIVKRSMAANQSGDPHLELIAFAGKTKWRRHAMRTAAGTANQIAADWAYYANASVAGQLAFG